MTRLATGGLIDRTRALAFTFDGRSFAGHPGDTLASALLANGVRLMGRSFKYHRPRGVLTAGPEEPNALVELRAGARREPNTRAPAVELYDGLSARSQNRWPSLAFDLLSVNRLAAPLLGAGFYYKTFMWPAAFWEKLYEPMIRRAAGLGRASAEPDPDTYEKVTAHCDVLVIGAGAAGLAAALAAGRAGARVILVEEDFRLGGSLLFEEAAIDGAPALDFVTRAEAELKSLPEVRILSRTTLFGAYDGGTYGAVERVADHLVAPPPFAPRQRLWTIIARRAVLAAGAFDRPAVFPGNDRPGILTAKALAAYARRFAVAPGARAALFANNDFAVASALSAARAGLRLEAVVDSREAIAPVLAEAAQALGVRLILGGEVSGTAGRTLRAVTVRTPSGEERLAVDTLAVSGGATPNIALACHLGGRPVYDPAIAAFVPGVLPPGLSVAGAAAGHLPLARCLAEGAAKGREAAEAAGFSAPAGPVPLAGETDFAPGGTRHARWTGGKATAFVDFQNDVTAKDIALAHREGFRAPELLKRYTTLGMATDQGKTSNMAGLALLADLNGQELSEAGVPRFRPPYAPVALGVLAGHHRGGDFRPTRPTPTHAFAERNGAVFTTAGLWLRAAYFPRAGERDWRASVDREVRATREAVGVVDVSTFGKIDLQGPDAAALLDFVYINTFSTLPVGRARYGVMLREDGFVMDDGTTARLGESHYVMTTTTANAARVYQHLEFCLQVLRPDLDVQLASVSEQWAQVAVSGPKSRAVLEQVVDGLDVSDAALPFMGVAQGRVLGGVPARIFRLSFSGELGFEISVPAGQGEALMGALMAAGAPFGITAYGTEALGVMRIEKGHASGPELNGQTTVRDLGLGRLASMKKDYVGRVLAGRPALTDPERPILVGFRPLEEGARLRAGAHVLAPGATANTENDEGHLSSAAYSPTLGHFIALGFLKRGRERYGEEVRVYDPVRGGDGRALVCAPHFVDPEGARQRG